MITKGGRLKAASFASECKRSLTNTGQLSKTSVRRSRRGTSSEQLSPGDAKKKSEKPDTSVPRLCVVIAGDRGHIAAWLGAGYKRALNVELTSIYVALNARVFFRGVLQV